MAGDRSCNKFCEIVYRDTEKTYGLQYDDKFIKVLQKS